MEQPLPTPQIPLSPAAQPPSIPSVPPTGIHQEVPTRRSNPRILLIVGISVGFLILAAVGFAAWNGWISFFQTPPTLSEVASALDNITSAKMDTTVSLKVEPRAAESEPMKLFPEKETQSPADDETPRGLDFSTNVLEQLLISSIPTDLDLSLTVSTVGKWSADKTDAETAIKGTWKTGGFTAEIDAAFKRAADTSYLQINRLPIPFIDVNSIANTWVELPEGIKNFEDLANYKDPDKEVFGEPTERTTANKTPDVSFQEDARSFLREALLNGAVDVSSVDPKAKVGNRSAWRLTLAFDYDKLLAAFKNRCDAVKENGTSHSLFTENACQPPTQSQREYIHSLLKGFRTEVWVDKKSQTPSRVAFNLVIAPDTEIQKFKDKQLHLSVDLILSDINQAVTIGVPTPSIPLDRAEQLISGQSEAETIFGDQTVIVRDLRTALKNYQEKNGSFPASLDALLGTEHEGLTKTQVVVHIPLDQYTGKAFPYIPSTDDYALTYTVKLPPPERGGFLSSVWANRYVDGVNTATRYAVSKEAMTGRDTDKDGLDDYQEAVHGTDPNNSDTDGDGFTDKQEVDSGHDPLKNAKTGKTVPPHKSLDSLF